MITLARRVADVRGSAIRDLLTLTARPEVISLAGGLPAADLLPRERIAAAAARALTDPAAVQYAEAAIAQYWIIDLDEPAALRAFTLVGDSYELSGEFTGPVTLDVAGHAVTVDPGSLTRR